MDELDSLSAGIPQTPQIQDLFPNLIISREFSLQNHSLSDKEKIKEEVLDKVHRWQNDMTKFHGEYNEYAQSWRIQPTVSNARRSRGLSNSKSGETHRATETMATLFFRMLTANDSYFQCVGRGLNEFGGKISEQEIYAVEQVLINQQRRLHFKHELLKSLTSLSLFGTMIFEMPWIRLLNADGTTYFEGTGLQLRPLITTGFDTNVFDIELSDYIFTVDYLTKWRLKRLVTNEGDGWDSKEFKKYLSDSGSYGKKQQTDVFNKITERKQRAGYNVVDDGLDELISYHGKLDTENPIIQDYWESKGFQSDPRDYDFTVKILNGEPVVGFHLTQYGTWRSRFKSVHFKSFELEPLSYGVGSLARRTQRDIDTSLSRANDTLLFAQYGIFKLGRYAGLKPSQLQIRPHQILEMDDINQLEPLKVDLNSIVQALAFQGVLREELRTNTGATANLQAIITKATATESTLTQTEAMRAGGVHAEIIGEPLIREFLEQSHINNLDNLDEGIWVEISGEDKPRKIDRYSLPKNVGFDIRITTDKDFRPERVTKLLEGLQMATSIRNVVPQSINVVVPLFEEYFRSIGMNPRLLKQEMSVQDSMLYNMQKAQRMGQNPQLGYENQSELASEEGGGNASVSTPMGEVPTSPVQNLTSVGNLG